MPAARPGARACRTRRTTWSCGCPARPNPEFLLLQPMVPSTRPNMIAWVAARMDAPNYGAVRVYRFPQNTSVLGPNQIEAKIDADPIDQRPDHPVEPVRQQGHPGQPHRDPDPGRAHLPPAGLPPVGQQRLPGVPADRPGDLEEDRLGLDPGRGARTSCSPAGPARRRLRRPTPSPVARRRRPARPRRAARAGPRRPATSPRWSPTPTTTSSWPRRPFGPATSRPTAQEMAKVQDALRQLDALVNVSPAP